MRREATTSSLKGDGYGMTIITKTEDTARLNSHVSPANMQDWCKQTCHYHILQRVCEQHVKGTHKTRSSSAVDAGVVVRRQRGRTRIVGGLAVGRSCNFSLEVTFLCHLRRAFSLEFLNLPLFLLHVLHNRRASSVHFFQFATPRFNFTLARLNFTLQTLKSSQITSDYLVHKHLVDPIAFLLLVRHHV
jgi:hypothetical protein